MIKLEKFDGHYKGTWILRMWKLRITRHTTWTLNEEPVAWSIEWIANWVEHQAPLKQLYSSLNYSLLVKGVIMYTCMTCELEFDLQDYVLGTDFVCPHCLVVDSEEIDPAQAGLISIVIYI